MTGRLALLLTTVALLSAMRVTPAAAAEFDPGFTPPSNVAQAIRDLVTFAGEAVGPDEFERRSDHLMRQLSELWASAVDGSSVAAGTAVALASHTDGGSARARVWLPGARANRDEPA